MNQFHRRTCPLVAAAIVLCSAAASANDFISLFTNESLEGWVEEQHGFFRKEHPNARTWKVHQGVVSCDGSQGNCGFLRYDRKLCDFILQLEYRMSKGCNSGVGLRAPKPYDGDDLSTLPSQSGFEVQICDDASLPPNERSSGAFYGQLAAKENAAKPAGEWNKLEVFCEGPTIRVTLNDKVVQDIDYSQIQNLKNRSSCGFISLQNHGHDTEFRNVKLKELNSAH